MKAWCSIMLLAAAAPGSIAAEQSAPPAESSIGAAKRELDAIKAATRNPAALEQKAELPSLAAPELHLSKQKQNSLTKRERLTREELEAQRKSKTWLLDAMEKEKELDEAARGGRKGRAELESERLLAEREELRNPELELDPYDPAAIALREADAAAKEEEQRRDRGARETPPANNPLAGYMASWMTPQDFALLQPNLDAGPAENGALEFGTASAAAPGAGATPSLPNPGGEFSPSLFGDRSGVAAPAGAENPYLQPLFPAVQLDTVLMPTPPAMPSPAPTSTPVLGPTPRREEPPAKAKIPDFVRPSDNEKYFKQLKRF